MDLLWGLLIGVIAGLLVGGLAGYVWRKSVAERKIGSAEKQAKQLLEDAIKQAETRKKETLLIKLMAICPIRIVLMLLSCMTRTAMTALQILMI